MNIHHLQAIYEVVRQGMHISAAASALHKSQPGISRQIHELETELGVQIFRRKRNRIEELTPAGQELIRVAERILLDIKNMRIIGAEHAKESSGDLTLATTHTQARYALPDVIERFMKAFPGVRLALKQGTPVQCCDMVSAGQADFAICTEPDTAVDELVFIPAYRITQCVATRADHPLLRERELTLAALARYPIITFGRRAVHDAFSRAGIAPHWLLSAVDADVGKAYVQRGMGIAILSRSAVDPVNDRDLCILDARHLFESSFVTVVLRRNSYLRGYMSSFIEGFAPQLTPSLLKRALEGSVSIERLHRTARMQTGEARPRVPRSRSRAQRA